MPVLTLMATLRLVHDRTPPLAILLWWAAILFLAKVLLSSHTMETAQQLWLWASPVLESIASQTTSHDIP